MKKAFSFHNITARHHRWLVMESEKLGTSINSVLKNLIEREILRTGWTQRTTVDNSENERL